MRLIDADAKVTALLYDEEHEETKRAEMTIADFLDSHTEEGCPQSGGWISVKDRLPEEQKIMIATLAYQHSSNYVLIYIDNITWPYNRKLITIGRYDYDESRWVVRNAFLGKVTHWMPLPEPPKET